MERILNQLSLSKQEERVLLLSMSGLGDKEVAREMGVAFETVRTYWQRIRTKVGSRTRAELIARLVKEGAGRALEERATENERLMAEISHRREAEQRFRSMAETAPIGVFVASPEGQCLYVNGEWQRISGMTQQQACGAGWLKAVHPDDLAKLDLDWLEQKAKGEPLVTELRFLRPDGSILWCQVKASEMRVEGEVTGSVGTVENITERRENEQRLKKAHDFISAILNAVGCLVVVLDPSGAVVRFNRTAEIATGYTEAELLGKPYFDLLVRTEEQEEGRHRFSELLAGKILAETERRWRRRDGAEIAISWSNTVLLDSEGSVEFLIGTGVDITEKRSLAKEARIGGERIPGFANGHLRSEIDFGVLTGYAMHASHEKRDLETV